MACLQRGALPPVLGACERVGARSVLEALGSLLGLRSVGLVLGRVALRARVARSLGRDRIRRCRVEHAEGGSRVRHPGHGPRRPAVASRHASLQGRSARCGPQPGGGEACRPPRRACGGAPDPGRPERNSTGARRRSQTERPFPASALSSPLRRRRSRTSGPGGARAPSVRGGAPSPRRGESATARPTPPARAGRSRPAAPAVRPRTERSGPAAPPAARPRTGRPRPAGPPAAAARGGKSPAGAGGLARGRADPPARRPRQR